MPSEEVLGWLEDLGWGSCADDPLVGSLTRAVADARAAGVPLSDASVKAYAEAARRLAAVDVEIAVAAPTPEAACTSSWSAR